MGYREVVLEDGPQAFWRLGDAAGSATAADETTNANDATASGSPTFGATGALTGDSDTAVTFDGADDLFTRDDIATYIAGGKSWSFEFWAKSTDTAGQAIPFSTSRTGDQGDYVIVQFNSSDVAGIDTNYVKVAIENAGGTNIVYTSNGAHVDGNWHHYVVTHDTVTCRFYFDGELVASANKNPTASPDRLTIGALRRSSTDYYFNGSLDEVAVYGHTLTARQVRTHYYRGKGYTGYALEVLADGPKGFWRLGDASGATATAEVGPDATYNGPTLGATGALTGDTDTAVTLDGTNDYVAIPDHADWDVAQAVTLEAWVKTSATGSFQQILDRDEGSGLHRAFQFRINDTNVLAAIFFGGGSPASATGTTTLTDGAWHHVAATYDGSRIRVYVDGEEDGSANESGSLPTGSAQIHIGRYQGGPSQYFNGSVDEAAFYNTVLSAIEVRRHYYAGLGYSGYELEVLASGPTSWWRLGEASGSTATDEKSAHAGTYTAGVTLGETSLVPAETDTAVGITGTNYVEIADSTDFEVEPAYTVEMWVKVTDPSLSALSVFLDKTGLSSSNYQWAIWWDNRSGTADAPVLRFHAAPNNSTGWTGAAAQSAVAAGGHLVCVANGANTRIYWNGEMKVETSLTINLSANSLPLRIGNVANGTGFPLNGIIDDVAYYPRALSADEVLYHYNAGERGASEGVTVPMFKYWDGSAWTAKPVKYWDGSQWATPTAVKYWDGSAWVAL